MGDSEVITNPSLPHQREILELVRLATEAYEDPNYLAIVLVGAHEHGRWLLQRLQDSVKWDISDTKLFREGVEVKGGGRVIIRSWQNPGVLHGYKPTKIVLFGDLGELFYAINSMECLIEAVA